MKKVLLVLAGVLALAIVLVLALAATKPTEFTIERRTTIAATPEEVYGILADLRRFPAWSPWARLDPNLTSTFEGTAGTVGASYHWKGNDQVGEGEMTIVEATPPRRVALRLEFIAPFPATNEVEWSVTPRGNGSEVRWSMTGRRNFMMKVMGVFMDIDAMVGGDFERGLANLKRIAERA